MCSCCRRRIISLRQSAKISAIGPNVQFYSENFEFGQFWLFFWHLRVIYIDEIMIPFEKVTATPYLVEKPHFVRIKKFWYGIFLEIGQTCHFYTKWPKTCQL